MNGFFACFGNSQRAEFAVGGGNSHSANPLAQSELPRLPAFVMRGGHPYRLLIKKGDELNVVYGRCDRQGEWHYLKHEELMAFSNKKLPFREKFKPENIRNIYMKSADAEAIDLKEMYANIKPYNRSKTIDLNKIRDQKENGMNYMNVEGENGEKYIEEVERLISRESSLLDDLETMNAAYGMMTFTLASRHVDEIVKKTIEWGAENKVDSNGIGDGVNTGFTELDLLLRLLFLPDALGATHDGLSYKKQVDSVSKELKNLCEQYKKTENNPANAIALSQLESQIKAKASQLDGLMNEQAKIFHYVMRDAVLQHPALAMSTFSDILDLVHKYVGSDTPKLLNDVAKVIGTTLTTISVVSSFLSMAQSMADRYQLIPLRRKYFKECSNFTSLHAKYDALTKKDNENNKFNSSICGLAGAAAKHARRKLRHVNRLQSLANVRGLVGFSTAIAGIASIFFTAGAAVVAAFIVKSLSIGSSLSFLSSAVFKLTHLRKNALARECRKAEAEAFINAYGSGGLRQLFYGQGAENEGAFDIQSDASKFKKFSDLLPKNDRVKVQMRHKGPSVHKLIANDKKNSVEINKSVSDFLRENEYLAAHFIEDDIHDCIKEGKDLSTSIGYNFLVVSGCTAEHLKLLRTVAESAIADDSQSIAAAASPPNSKATEKKLADVRKATHLVAAEIFGVDASSEHFREVASDDFEKDLLEMLQQESMAEIKDRNSEYQTAKDKLSSRRIFNVKNKFKSNVTKENVMAAGDAKRKLEKSKTDAANGNEDVKVAIANRPNVLSQKSSFNVVPSNSADIVPSVARVEVSESVVTNMPYVSVDIMLRESIKTRSDNLLGDKVTIAWALRIKDPLAKTNFPPSDVEVADKTSFEEIIKHVEVLEHERKKWKIRRFCDASMKNAKDYVKHIVDVLPNNKHSVGGVFSIYRGKLGNKDLIIQNRNWRYVSALTLRKYYEANQGRYPGTSAADVNLRTLINDFRRDLQFEMQVVDRARHTASLDEQVQPTGNRFKRFRDERIHRRGAKLSETLDRMRDLERVLIAFNAIPPELESVDSLMLNEYEVDILDLHKMREIVIQCVSEVEDNSFRGGQGPVNVFYSKNADGTYFNPLDGYLKIANEFHDKCVSIEHKYEAKLNLLRSEAAGLNGLSPDSADLMLGNGVERGALVDQVQASISKLETYLKKIVSMRNRVSSGSEILNTFVKWEQDLPFELGANA